MASKINHLLQNWPMATVATTKWLAKVGAYQQLVQKYEASGWIRRIGQGAYVRAGDSAEWPGGVYALQTQLGLHVHPGGKTALELAGLGHFVAAGKDAKVHLFANARTKLPAWFLNHRWNCSVTLKVPNLLEGEPEFGLTTHPFGHFTISIAGPERAMLELLHLVPEEQSAEESQLLMEGLGTLRPKTVQTLLERCRSIKAKRLFLALAERCNHAWLEELDPARLNLGKGKRMVVRNGVLDRKYQVTLPRPDTK